MNITKKERTVKLSHDTVGEFTLPDYLPAISKLLLAECSVTPEDPYVKESSSGLVAELGGEALFRILWLGEGENEPVAATFRCDFDTSAPIGTFPSGRVPVCHTETLVENVFCRVTGPRKLSLRARLSSRMFVTSESESKTPESLLSPSVETQKEEISVIETVTGKARDLYAAAKLPEDTLPASVGSVIVGSCKPLSNDSVSAEGEIVLHCFQKRSGELSSDDICVPFEETVPLSGELSDTSSLSLYCIGTVNSVNVTHDESSPPTAEITFSLTAVAATEGKVSIERDAYSCVYNSVAETEKIQYLTRPKSVTAAFTLNEKCDSAPKNSQVLYCGGSSSIESVAVENGKLRITGNLSGNIITKSGEDFTSTPYSFPWKYEFDEKDLPDGCEIEYLGCSVPTSLRAQCDNSTTVTAEIALSLLTVREDLAERVRELTVSEDVSITSPPYSIAVYFPEKNEKVWDIAKHFRVPTARVATVANLNEDGTPKNVVVI